MGVEFYLFRPARPSLGIAAAVNKITSPDVHKITKGKRDKKEVAEMKSINFDSSEGEGEGEEETKGERPVRKKEKPGAMPTRREMEAMEKEERRREKERLKEIERANRRALFSNTKSNRSISPARDRSRSPGMSPSALRSRSASPKAARFRLDDSDDDSYDETRHRQPLKAQLTTQPHQLHMRGPVSSMARWMSGQEPIYDDLLREKKRVEQELC